MANRKYYFQRANRYWEKTDDISLNAYINILRYVKCMVSEKEVNILLGGHIPCYKNGQFQTERIEQEKNLSYLMGLYYEEYYHDNMESYFDGIHKNLKMRIALVIVYINTFYNNEYINNLPVVCCGVNENNKTLIVVNPFNGEYEEQDIKSCFENSDNCKKFTILNVPGMIRMQQIEIKESIISALKLYIKRFLYFKNQYIMDMTGLEFFELCIKNKIQLKDLSVFIKHKNIQIKWLYDLRLLLQAMDKKIYINIIDVFIQLYKKSIDLNYHDELNYIYKMLYKNLDF